ncbi:MAG: hypothetical protein WCT85_06050 [Parachlamydiales bacterium]
MLLGPFILEFIKTITTPYIVICITIILLTKRFSQEIKLLFPRLIELHIEWKNKKIKIKFADTIIKSDLPSEEKIKLLDIFYHEDLQFLANRTSKIENITGNGELYDAIQFINENLNINRGIFTANTSGKYLITWNIPIENISNQSTGHLFLETSNQKILSTSINPSQNKDKSNKYIFTGSHIVEMDTGDTAKIIIQIGTQNDPKTISLSESESSFFGGFFIGKTF